eukprot:TRINITY_DN3444_c0_g1_i2.p1 TRINITY_DN3444_c0_g1~~TRINITY_DN3444_c0_g1_i2.p1  ORF type:complete len:395 (+),score=62.28 TRINITY_DN3444_c0_g1_i2:132-1316(+)
MSVPRRSTRLAAIKPTEVVAKQQELPSLKNQLETKTKKGMKRTKDGDVKKQKKKGVQEEQKKIQEEEESKREVVEEDKSSQNGSEDGQTAKKKQKKEGKKGKKNDYVGPLYDENTMRQPLCQGSSFRVASWNVAGLKALLKKDENAFKNIVELEGFDVICLQETKLQEAGALEIQKSLQEQLGKEWEFHWNCSNERKGYAGTALFTKVRPLAVTKGIFMDQHDGEGRVIAAEFDDKYVVNVYVPNAGTGLKRLDYRVKEWDQDFSQYVLKLLKKEKQVVIVGDMNCAHKEIDIRNPKTNLRSAGFTIEERESFQQVYLDNGFVDTFRHQHPGIVAYSYWGYRFNCREKNIGWRLDYVLVSENLVKNVHDSFMMQKVMGSDHCPIGLILKQDVEE